MTDRGWKAAERTLARLIGGRRVPVSGRGRGDQPDIAHPWLSIECKHRQTIPAWLTDALAQARAAAHRDQLPVALIHQHGARYGQTLVVMTLDDFTAWFGDGHDTAREEPA
jgi:hypothetical protein